MNIFNFDLCFFIYLRYNFFRYALKIVVLFLIRKYYLAYNSLLLFKTYQNFPIKFNIFEIKFNNLKVNIDSFLSKWLFIWI